MNLAKLLSFPTTDSNAVFMTNSTHKIDDAYAKLIKAIHTAVTQMGTEGATYLINSAIIPLRCKISASKDARPKLRTAIEEPFQIARRIILLLHLADLCTRVWLDIAPQRIAIILPGTLFMDRFICGIFL